MNVDKFGHHIHKNKRFKCDVYSTECVLDLTYDGQFDAKDKLIKNVQLQKDIQDCATKGYVDKLSDVFFKRLQTLEQSFTELNRVIENNIKINDNKKIKND